MIGFFCQVQDAINALARSLTTYSDEGIEVCPVCFTPPESEERIRLQNCGHLYCTDCLKMQINSATWPLVCSTEVCLSHISYSYLEFWYSGMWFIVGSRRFQILGKWWKSDAKAAKKCAGQQAYERELHLESLSKPQLSRGIQNIARWRGCWKSWPFFLFILWGQYLQKVVCALKMIVTSEHIF